MQAIPALTRGPFSICLFELIARQMTPLRRHRTTLAKTEKLKTLGALAEGRPLGSSQRVPGPSLPRACAPIVSELLLKFRKNSNRPEGR
jgi:hypothetical protein